jgi:peptidoglycan/LPS O-acetylase OafA/YrhL
MIYHLTGWFFFHPDASSFLGKAGVYGVSVFFVLSGLSMAIVYNRLLKSPLQIASFFVRRFFRILPLLWVATITTILISDQTAPLSQIILNLTGLFGFTPDTGSIATGAWSIGNEMVYYAFTPLFIAAYNYRKWAGNLSLSITCIVAAYFAFSLLSPTDKLAYQWGTYINPFNNLFLYTAGISIYYNLKEIQFRQSQVILLLSISIACFTLFPSEGNQITLVTGWNRVIFSLLSIMLVIGFYKFTLKIPKIITIPLEKSGIASYGVYMLHPLFKVGVLNLFYEIGWRGKYNYTFTIISVTILASLLLYNTVEVRIMQWGKRITAGWTQ